MTETPSEPTNEAAGEPVERERMDFVELAAALLLGIAAVLTAYAAYHGALAGGDALKGYTQSARTTADANGYYNEASQTYNADQALFLQYQLLVEQGNLDTAKVVKDTMFSPELNAATDAWQALPDGPNAPKTPLEADAYVVPSFATAQQVEAQAKTEFDEAAKIDDQGDNFDLAAVYLAVALFFAGIAALFKVRSIQIAMLIGSGLMLIPGLIAIANGKPWG
jgi:hypothetical protein